MGSSPKSTTTTTKNEPWDEAKPYFNDLYASAEDARKSGKPEYYPGSTVIDWSKPTTDAYAQQEQMARDPATGAILQNANNSTNDILNGTAWSSTPGNTFQNLQGNIDTGTNPYMNTYNAFANGSMRGGFGQTGALQRMAEYNNPGVGATAAAAGTASNDAAQQLNANGGYTNAATAGQTAQAEQLAGATNSGTQYLTEMAGGGAENPFLEAYRTNQLGDLQEQFQKALATDNSRFAAAGRTGSGAFANQLNSTTKNASDSMAKAYTDLGYQDWTDRQNRALSAAGQISSNYNSDVANSANAWSNLANTSQGQQGLRNDALNASGNLQNAYSNILLGAANQMGNQSVAEQGVRAGALDSLRSQYNQDNQDQLNAANSGSAAFQNDVANRLKALGINLDAANAQSAADSNRANTQLNAANSAGTIYDNQYAGLEKLKGVGAAQEQQQGAYLQDDINRWNSEQNAVWDGLMKQASILTGGGYNTSSKEQPIYSNTGAQIAGSAASAIPAMATKMACDERLKENIIRIGATDAGVPLYVFNYRDDASKSIRIGPMAQEVETVVPHAVEEMSSGFKAVNIRALVAHNAATAATRCY